VDPVSGIASAGLRDASRELTVSATRVARAMAPRPAQAQPLPKNDAGVESRIDGAVVGIGSGVDLIRESINQSVAAVAYKANLATLRTADEVQQSLMDVVS
jgi:hypothetical protein